MIAAAVLSRYECRQIVKSYLETEDNFELKSFSVSPLSGGTESLMGDHLTLRILASPGDQNSQDVMPLELQFFVKTLPLNNPYSRNYATSTLAYQKEVLFFGDLLRGVKKHLRCAEEEASTYLGSVPQCFYLRPDLLVMEDLALDGFRMLDPMEPLNLAQSECVMKAMARLHGASLVFEEREGRLLADVYPLLLQETFFKKEKGFPPYDAQLCYLRIAHVLLDLVPRFAPGTPHNEELHRLLDPAMDEIYKLIKPSDTYRNVLCHRDLLVNNMMFAEDARGDLSVRLVDFQSLHLEPPTHDVMIFLHLCMVHEVRKANYWRLLELYHQTLAEVLHHHGFDIDLILPLPVFLQACKEAKPVAVLLAAYTLQDTMLPKTKDPVLKDLVYDRANFVRAAYQRDERFRARMTEVVRELVETCLMPRLENQQQPPHSVKEEPQQPPRSIKEEPLQHLHNIKAEPQQSLRFVKEEPQQ